jgi:DNA-binding NtrC family response regulator
LGLSICQQIVRGLGGEIQVSSELGKGSTFRVLLPVATENEARTRTPTAAPQANGRRARILFVDDERTLGLALKRFLGREHEVVLLESAKEARDRLTAGEQFDVVLCDLLMPEMTGMDLHEQLSTALPDLARRMVFMTGGAFTPRAREFLNQIHNPVLEKPIDLDQLRRQIAALLDSPAPKPA